MLFCDSSKTARLSNVHLLNPLALMMCNGPIMSSAFLVWISILWSKISMSQYQDGNHCNQRCHKQKAKIATISISGSQLGFSDNTQSGSSMSTCAFKVTIYMQLHPLLVCSHHNVDIVFTLCNFCPK